MMQFGTTLIRAQLVKRYKRFLADIVLPNGETVTAHCANPGSMMGLADAGSTVWVEPNDDPRKKLKYGWRLVELANGNYVNIDTSIANRVVQEALITGQIAEIGTPKSLKAEVPYAQNSRVDFLATDDSDQPVYIEVKSVTLSRKSGLAEFPDSVTARGARHMADLAQMVKQGHRAVLIYVVMRTDCISCRVASDIDPTYAAAMLNAQNSGVEIYAYDTKINQMGISIGKPVPFG